MIEKIKKIAGFSALITPNYANIKVAAIYTGLPQT